MTITVSAWRCAPSAFGHVSGRSLTAALIVVTIVGVQLQSADAQTKTGVIRPLINPLVDEFDNSIPLVETDTLLYSTNADPHFQVLTPDGDPVTLDDWLGVGGAGEITRTAEGTAVSLDVTGLVPNGLYTAWGLYFQEPPFNFQMMANGGASVAAGAVGMNDGSDNSFTADANGDATFEVVLPPGPLSQRGEVGGFALDGYSSFAIAAVYHNDGMTYGTVPGPMHVGAFTVGFVPEPSSVALALMACCGVVGATILRRRKAT